MGAQPTHETEGLDCLAEARVVQMLRLEARRRAAKPLTEDQASRLESWISRLVEMNAVVGYDHDSEDGFYYTRRRKSDKDIIRQPRS